MILERIVVSSVLELGAAVFLRWPAIGRLAPGFCAWRWPMLAARVARLARGTVARFVPALARHFDDIHAASVNATAAQK
jgi:hypothetical protein